MNGDLSFCGASLFQKGYAIYDQIEVRVLGEVKEEDGSGQRDLMQDPVP